MKITGKTIFEISDCIRSLVRDGDLAPSDSLPPVRDLAEALDVNRNTVAAAYQRLVQAGFAVAQGRLGTSIAYPPTTGEQEGTSLETPLVNLASGNPGARWLPNPVELLASNPPGAFLYGEQTILPSLMELAEEWVKADCPAQRSIELTHGAVDAIERLAAAQLVPGDKVAVEDPCFLGSISALRLAGMKTLGMAVDEAGVLPEALEAAIAGGARAVLLTPRAHNPTGCSLSKRRADALKAILAAHPGVMVIADDHFALLAETPYYSVIPASTQRWALVRSVSKGLGPDLRVAVVACDLETGDRLRTRLASGMTWVSHLLQAIVVAALRSPAVRQLLGDARDDYARRRSFLRTALRAVGIDTPPPAGGFNLWIPLPDDAKDIAYELAKRGWLVRIGNAFEIQDASQALRITVSDLEDEVALRFAQDLKACLA
ncbi:MocR-like B6 salvage transcription factor PtsJ [Comamonas koreensis]|uniref:Transcriptional regulator PtsJ n=1 Tax=Comamonas koreensis TaxID=160825 RepID=A0AAW4Y094_9BURK|nr:transcriptional regulator PtsJ [Comamonas koreensis]MCD2166678.1 transcriptional regulator PtsJ [Comamonas koreensis]